MPNAVVKVLYIVGYPHSGTTILGNLLGELDSFFHAGEIRYLWERNVLMKRRRCGCGKTVERCEVWSAVLREVTLQGPIMPANEASSDGVSPEPGSALEAQAMHVVRWQRQVARSRHIWRLLRHQHGSAMTWAPLERYIHVLGRLYRSLGRTTDSRVVVDTSKWPADAAVVGLVPGIDPYFVHLVRDPRGIVYSRQRKKASLSADGTIRSRRHLLSYDALGWAGLNLASEAVCRRAVGRSLLVRYEQFVRDPRGTIGAIARLVGEEPSRMPFLDERTATLAPNHTAGGNRNRFTVGAVELCEDERWHTGLRASDQLAATALSLPVLVRYGYPIMPSQVADRMRRRVERRW